MRQNVTKNPHSVTSEAVDESPSPAQEIAIAAMISGASTTEAGAMAGVSRVTVSRWRNHDDVFIAAYNTARFEVIEVRKAAILALSGKAVQVLADILQAEDTPPSLRRQVAIDILKSTCVLEPEAHSISTRECDPVLLKSDRLRIAIDPAVADDDLLESLQKLEASFGNK